MIRALALHNFKCFEALHLDLTRLTLLTGFNAAGKSTSLQTLLLLSQTLRGHRSASELRLNGPLVSLGSPGDVINSKAGSNRLALGITTSDVELLWHFAVPEETRRSLRVSHLDVKAETSSSSIKAPDLDGVRPRAVQASVERALKLLDRLIFLSAARQVETEIFPLPLDGGEIQGDVGPIGQYAPWWLHQEGDSEVASNRRCPSESASSTLRHQVNAWAAELFPHAEINALPIPRTNLMRLELKTGPTSDWSRPANIGYGISYAFPILIAGLCASEEQPVVIDSPEAHLHPRGQSRIGSFLTRMAAAGSQIVIETHSDHVLNGIRVSVREGLIDPAQVTIYFFTNLPEPQIIRLSIDKNGTISDWPDGFFDQSEKDLANLAGWT